MAAINNLYPPIVDTYMPAFLINSENVEKNICRVYFSLSLFNTQEQIANVQIVVRNNTTNLNALNPTKYPSGIKISQLKIDDTKVTDDKYYIEIEPTDMINTNFLVDQYYKVQLCFTDTEASELPFDITDPDVNQEGLDTWLINNALHFSEWSTVCLIRGISTPHLILPDFDEGQQTTVWDTIANTRIIGTLTFEDENENETLRSYQIKLYNNQDEMILDSGIIYTSNFTNLNEINYEIKYALEANQAYYFTLEYITQNLYIEINTYEIEVLSSTHEDSNVIVKAWTDEENGRIQIKVNRSAGYGNFSGNIYIRRTDSNSNFTVWDDIYIQSYRGADFINFTWNDYTIESGVWYLYAVQLSNEEGARAPMIKFNSPIMMTFDHIFLTAKDKQLKIKFNPQISSFKRVLSESKTDTIGSKYPFIKRNGYVDYRQFPLGGLISSAMDETGLFTNKEEIYGNLQESYDEYNDLNNIHIYNDFIYERFFRNKVDEFLNRDGAVLFRSPTEGNILIRLMDINYSPNQTLGRRIWAFTSTAYEIDDCTIDNYEKYDIFDRVHGTIYAANGSSNLTPIRRIVFINDKSEFPEEGNSQVLYIYNKDVYIWDEDEHMYIIISVPLWNISNPTDPESVSAVTASLFTDGRSLFTWDSSTENFNRISEPLVNNSGEDVNQHVDR